MKPKIDSLGGFGQDRTERELLGIKLWCEGNSGANAEKYNNHNKKSLVKKKNHIKEELRGGLQFCQVAVAISLSLLSPIPPFLRASPSGQLAQRDERRKKGEKEASQLTLFS